MGSCNNYCPVWSQCGYQHKGYCDCVQQRKFVPTEETVQSLVSAATAPGETQTAAAPALLMPATILGLLEGWMQGAITLMECGPDDTRRQTARRGKAILERIKYLPVGPGSNVPEPITFTDTDGRIRKLVWNLGDESVGLFPGWDALEEGIPARVVLPVSPRPDLEADDAMRRALIWMGRAITEIECDCEAEGHVCGRPELQRDTELLSKVRKRLAAPVSPRTPAPRPMEEGKGVDDEETDLERALQAVMVAGLYDAEYLIRSYLYGRKKDGEPSEAEGREGGCQLHNLHCGYPACDQAPAKKEGEA